MVGQEFLEGKVQRLLIELKSSNCILSTKLILMILLRYILAEVSLDVRIRLCFVCLKRKLMDVNLLQELAIYTLILSLISLNMLNLYILKKEPHFFCKNMDQTCHYLLAEIIIQNQFLLLCQCFILKTSLHLLIQ